MTTSYTREWVAKAEEDYLSAETLLRRRILPLPNSVCFHAHQCAEKYLKAVLAERRRPIRKTHDLIVLLEEIAGLDGQFELIRDTLRALNPYAVAARYPGEGATPAGARRAMQVARSVRTFVRERLHL